MSSMRNSLQSVATLDDAGGKTTRVAPRIGSIKLNQVTFPKNEAFFFPDEQVPKPIRDLSHQVRISVLPDTLGTRGRGDWSKQTLVLEEGKRAEPSLRQHLLNIRYMGQYEGVPTKIRDHDNKTYRGTETRDVYRNWNVSTEVPTPKTKKRNIDAE